MHPLASEALFDQDVAALTDELAARRQWIWHVREYPTLECSFTAPGRTTLRVRLTCDDWNDRPPAVTLHTADGSFLVAKMRDSSNIFHPERHPSTGQFFVCMRGTREYHTHPSHVGEAWESLKQLENYKLGGILTQIWHGWEKGSG